MTAVASPLSAVDAFRSAERTLLEKQNLVGSERYLELAEPRLRVRILEFGEGDPVLMLPGLGAVAAAWAPLLAGLKGFRTIALERPGCGLSDGVDFARPDLRSPGTRPVAHPARPLGRRGPRR